MTETKFNNSPNRYLTLQGLYDREVTGTKIVEAFSTDSWTKEPQMFQKPSDEQLQNRYTYHAPKGDQQERYAAIRAKCLELAMFVRDNTPCCPDQSLAFTALDEVMFRANAAIARNE